MNELRFHQKPTLRDLGSVNINGSKFEEKEGLATEDSLVLTIPHFSVFPTKLEVFRNIDGSYDLIMTESSTKGLTYWEISDALNYLKLCNPKIEQQLIDMCNELIKKGLATWIN
mgnify:FL=1